MTDTILCIDIGTTSLKAAMLSDARKVEAFSRVPLDGKAECWMGALKKAVADMKAQNENAAVEAICVSGNGPTIVGEDSTTLLWNENAPTPKAKSGTKSLFIPRFKAFKKLFPKSWASSTKIFSGPEYMLYRLTGNAITILPEERFTPAYWTDAELSECGFSKEEISKFPTFKKMGSFVGQITEEAALATGLLEGTLVFAGAPDFVVALLGTGTIHPGTVCDRAGSSEGLNLCTTKPIFAEGIRTLPSAIPGLWNASVLIEDSGTRRFKDGRIDENGEESLLKEFSEAVEKLKKAAESNGEYFPPEISMTGGQCMDREWVSKKEKAAGVRIGVPYCQDAELIGDLILARVALGDYDDYEEACFVLFGNR